jgi:hypothetical protein
MAMIVPRDVLRDNICPNTRKHGGHLNFQAMCSKTKIILGILVYGRGILNIGRC